MQLFVRGQTLHSINLNGSETVAQIKVLFFWMSYIVNTVLGKVTFKSNALQYCITLKSI